MPRIFGGFLIQRKRCMIMKNKTIDLIGWILFTISAVGFCISSIGSFWAMFGSVFFLVACIVFMIPFLRKDK